MDNKYEKLLNLDEKRAKQVAEIVDEVLDGLVGIFKEFGKKWTDKEYFEFAEWWREE